MAKNIIKLEGLLVFTTCLYFYAQLDASWLIFVALWLIPDVSLLVYLANKHLGVYVYNLAHTYLLAVLLLAAGAWFNSWLLGLGIIWASHIGLDRFLGFGLKYLQENKITHIQKL